MEKPHTSRRFLARTIVATLLIAVITVSPLGSGCIGNKDASTQEHAMKLQVTGSTTVLPIAEECACVFMKNNPGSQICVSGSGSSHGVKAAADGTINIGDASRDMLDSERASHPGLVTHAIAKDGVAIVVHPESPVNGLTMQELKSIYAGEITNWKDIGYEDADIMVVSREEGSGTRDCFEQAVLAPAKEEITDHAIIQDSNGKMRTTVAGNKDTIRFLSLGYVNSDIRAVSLDGANPTIENIRSWDYAISRTLWMITKGEPDADEHAFLDFVLSEDGQEIVSKVHFISVSR
ncbi:MAG: phosphate ABC transporter substrate-binding protein [Euryarchaeota archaeon]|nr:phosphate ABC transporter substrate-binding protein [Euryarchaeota archaeon]